jgi:HrpA-like RNA helicase
VNYIECAVGWVKHIHECVGPEDEAASPEDGVGHILVFATGQEDISIICSEGTKVTLKLHVMPLLASQSAQEHERIFKDSPLQRKCIVSTNVAETSLTFRGVVYVIDIGLAKRSMYNPRCDLDMLNTVPISKANANQRKGRAGRTRKGRCFRLYTKETFNSLEESALPGIWTDDLKSMVLKLKAARRDNVLLLDWIDRPREENILRAKELLFHL